MGGEMRQGQFIPSLKVFSIAATLGLLFYVRPAWAFDIPDVQPVALDQPRVYALLRLTETADPLAHYDVTFDETIFNIEAFYDTGASGMILSHCTADFLGVPRTSGVVFEDVGVAGSDTFAVSEPLYVGIAPYTPSVDINNPDTASAVYDQSFGPLRTQISEIGDCTDPFDVDVLDIFGMPAMQGKVVVMDPKPLDTLADLMRTYVYDPGTPFDPGQLETNPGIPATNRHVLLRYADFGRFTQTTPAGAEGPTLNDNPFIGADPLAALDPNAPPDNTPGVTITLGAMQATGSFLLDTGSAASFISTDMAAMINVRYRTGTLGTDNPELEVFDPSNPSAPGTLLPNQFQLTISGIGGAQRAAGFFLDSLRVPTIEGDPLNFVSAPVLVVDISVKDPQTQDVLTLNGVFGMNFLVASAFVSENPFNIGPFKTDLFEWVVFDEPNGVLGLQVDGAPALVGGDLDADGDVDRVDRNIFIGSFGSCTGDVNFVAETDYNGTGCTDFSDYFTWYRFYKDFASIQPCEACGTDPSPRPAPKKMTWPQ